MGVKDGDGQGDEGVKAETGDDAQFAIRPVQALQAAPPYKRENKTGSQNGNGLQQMNEQLASESAIHGRRPCGHLPDEGSGHGDQEREDNYSGRTAAIVMPDRPGQFEQNSKLVEGVNCEFNEIKPEIPLRPDG